MRLYRVSVLVSEMEPAKDNFFVSYSPAGNKFQKDQNARNQAALSASNGNGTMIEF